MDALENQKIIPVDVEKEMKSSFLAYSMSVITSRALPDVRDGLKPVHRRIIYTLYEKGLTPDKPYHKSADTVGSVLGSYHPHGDASVYDALVRLAQDFSLRYPLVDGHGNFGSIDGDPPAAYRYTEAKMSKISMVMVQDIEKETVDFGPNYDDRLEEPLVLPSRFPNLLVNGSNGIAVGMATNIPPHNLCEVIDGICLLIDNPEATLEDIMQFIKGPDFPTGGVIMGRSGIRAAYATGRGKITVRAKAQIEEHNGRFRIVVTEIPYMVNKARVIENIADHVKDKKIEGISDLRDESDREGMRMVVELKKDANPQVVLNHLYSLTQLQDTFGVIMLALVDGVPKVLPLKSMLEEYLKFQCQVIRRRTEYELKKAKERAHILEGYKIAIDFIDEVVAILRRSKTVQEGKEALMERFGLDDVQASAIVAMRLGQLTGMERSKIEEELAALREKIKELEGILLSEEKVLQIVKEELLEIRRKYGDERRTAIENVSGEVDIEDLIPEEDCVITMTHFGYIKRLPADTYKAQNRGGRGISGMSRREEDFVSEMFVANSHDNILFITNRGRMYKLRCFEIAEGSRGARGVNIVNLLPIESGEKIAAMLNVGTDLTDGYLTMVTKNGQIKRTAMGAYVNIRKSGINAVTLKEGDELRGAFKTDGNADFFVATKNGMCIRFKEEGVRAVGRTASGVRAIKLRGDDEVVAATTIINDDEYILTVTDRGRGRKTAVSGYRCQTRGGLGTRNFKIDDEKGLVCGVCRVTDEDDAIMISENGIIIRIRICDVNPMSRYGSGVRVMRLSDDDRLVTFARAERDEDAEVEGIENDGEDISAEELAKQEANEIAAEQNETVEPDEE